MKSKTIELDPVIELACGRLYRLGASGPAGGATSWAPTEITESLPFNVYMTMDDAAACLVDTGPTVLYPGILDQCRRLIGERELQLLVTRNDPEAMGGVGWVVPELAPSVFYYFGGGSILEWVWDARLGPGGSGDLFGALPVASPSVVVLDERRHLEVLRPPLAVLNTVWIYDRATGTLFCSDAFTYVPPADGGPMTAERVRGFLSARFDWIDRINSDRLARALQEMLESLRVERLAPSHGVVIEGEQAVSDYLDLVLEVLRPR